MIQDFWDDVLLFKGLYDRTLDPVAQRCGLTRMELDLLLFLHNNPDHATAAEAVSITAPAITSEPARRRTSKVILCTPLLQGETPAGE